YCIVCGMHLPTFYKTNHAATTKDNHIRQYCSLHCFVYDNEINEKDLYDVKVVDVTSLKFISAQSAYYVVGSMKEGTMT
ncbi:MAG: nitrous oxide reductase accessory protein NosL, partial [Sulfurovum sp.]